MEDRLEGLLSRKFILAVLIVIAGLVGLLTDKITTDQFQGITIWIMGLFATANVGQKFLK